MNLFIGIGAFFIGSFLATIAGDMISATLLKQSDISEMIVRLPLWVTLIWLSYRGLKSVLNPSRKTYKSPTLDGDLTGAKEETEQ